MQSFFQKVFAKIVKWLDPKIAKYRQPEKKIPYTPQTEKDFVGVLKRTPESILTNTQRNMIANMMNFDHIPVSFIMSKRKDMMFLDESDFLGPLLLDKMFKTGNTHFPVLDKKGEVFGFVNTEKIDPLTITENQPLDEFINRNVNFVRSDYSLQMLLACLLRTDSTYCLVIDKKAHVIGSVTLDQLMTALFDYHIRDTFSADADKSAVAERSEK